MTLAPFATLAEVTTRLGQTLSAAQQAQVTAFLDDASGLIRDYCRQTITLVTDDTMTRESPEGPYLALPQVPLVSVTSVAINGQLVTDAKPDGNKLYRVYGWAWPSIDVIPPMALYGLLSTVTVVYTHGYATIPPPIATVCRQMVMRALTNLPGYKAVSLDDYSAEVGGPVGYGVFLADADMRSLRRYRTAAYSIDIGTGAVA